MKRFRNSLIAASVLAGALSAAPALADPIYVKIAPPAPIVEARVVAPGPDYVWIPGFHRWDGRAYVWVAGRWDRPPRPHAVWVAGHWRHHRNGWYWIEGRWK